MKVKYPIADGKNEYLLSVDSFGTQYLSDVGIVAPTELCEVVLERVAGADISSARVLSIVATYLKVYLSDNPNAILYFYCDDMHDICRRKEHQKYSPQEYRSLLFSKMFANEKTRAGANFPYLNNQIIIKTMNGTAYVHLINHEHNQGASNIICDQIKAQGKDDTSVTTSVY